MKITMLVGVPGSGKSWVTNQIKSDWHVVHNDDYIGKTNQIQAYLDAIVAASKTATKPILIEAPFSISQIKEPLELRGFEVECVFIIQDEKILSQRYESRDRRPVPKGHLSRQRTYLDRAKLWGSFVGTSDEVLKHLQSV